MFALSDSDWLYACEIARKTQDVTQRNLLELIAKMAGRALPAFPLPERRTTSAS